LLPPEGLRRFLAWAALLLSHRPMKGMFLGRALPRPKISCNAGRPGISTVS